MKMNGTLNLSREIGKVEKRIPAQEFTLGKALKQPFCNANSGSRKIMQGTQIEQIVQIMNPEIPIISTGYENEFGEYSSNFIIADKEYQVLAKIPKFINRSNDHYWLILYSRKDNYLTMIERTSYHHITEFFGYKFNNDYLDSLIPTKSIIHKDDVVKKTISYDEYNNRAEGLNLSTMYIACEDVKEDPIVISESAAKRFSCVLIDKIEVKINDNDILLNLYGKGNEYKTFPDIGEDVKDNIFCAVRRELKDEEALFSQSWDRLKTIMMNDKKFLCDDGKVIDIDVYCNNPDKLEDSMYNNQIKRYYDESKRFAQDFVNAVSPYIYDEKGNHLDINVSYELKKMFSNMRLITRNVQYIQDKVFSNIILVVYIEHIKPISRGDKITDRYGGKGVISQVRPDNMMPKYLKNGKWYPVDVLYSMCTCINRLNDGQLFETSLTYIGWNLIEYIKKNVKDYNVAFSLIIQYINIINPDEANKLLSMYKIDYGNGPDYMKSTKNFTSDDNQYDRDIFIECILNDGYIYIVTEPISGNMNIDKIRLLYKTFPFISKYCNIAVPIMDSNGNYRIVYSRRKVVIGYKYIFRLKQVVEEKFSAVSLASTNIRNENSKSKLSKTHNTRFAATPVRVYGEMESSTLSSHLGPDIFIEEFALNSSSPEARRRNEILLTGDPFAFNVELNDDCVSQSADILQAFLKVLGEHLCFSKVEKFKLTPALKMVARIEPRPSKSVAFTIDKEKLGLDPNTKVGEEINISDKERKIVKKEINRLHTIEMESMKKPLKVVATIDPGIKERHEALENYKAKLRSIGVDPKYVLNK